MICEQAEVSSQSGIQEGKGKKGEENKRKKKETKKDRKKDRTKEKKISESSMSTCTVQSPMPFFVGAPSPTLRGSPITYSVSFSDAIDSGESTGTSLKTMYLRPLNWVPPLVPSGATALLPW